MARMSDEALDEVHEDVDGPEGADQPRDTRTATRSALTRWVAARQLRNLTSPAAPSYERCQEKGCWGKASWVCPHCRAKACAPHRAEHHCGFSHVRR